MYIFLFVEVKLIIKSSDEEDFQTVRVLPSAKRVKLVQESKIKAEAKALAEAKTEVKQEAKQQAEDDTDDSEDYSTDSDSD